MEVEMDPFSWIGRMYVLLLVRCRMSIMALFGGLIQIYHSVCRLSRHRSTPPSWCIPRKPSKPLSFPNNNVCWENHALPSGHCYFPCHITKFSLWPIWSPSFRNPSPAAGAVCSVCGLQRGRPRFDLALARQTLGFPFPPGNDDDGADCRPKLRTHRISTGTKHSSIPIMTSRCSEAKNLSRASRRISMKLNRSSADIPPTWLLRCKIPCEERSKISGWTCSGINTTTKRLKAGWQITIATNKVRGASRLSLCITVIRLKLQYN